MHVRRRELSAISIKLGWEDSMRGQKGNYRFCSMNIKNYVNFNGGRNVLQNNKSPTNNKNSIFLDHRDLIEKETQYISVTVHSLFPDTSCVLSQESARF